MKKVIVALLFLNLALGVALVYYRQTQPFVLKNNITKKPTLSSTEKISTTNFHWRQIESEDYRKYIANMRGIGCPEETIRDVIIADVNRLYSARQAELLNENRARKTWWQPNKSSSVQSRTASQQLVRDLEKEKRALVHELLGIDLDEESENYALAPIETSWKLDSIPAEKREAVRTHLQKFDTLQKSLLGEADTNEDAPDWQTLREAYQKREAELTKLLSPAELEDFQLRNDEVAETLRHHLAAFHPTEQEFRDLFRNLKKHQDEFAYTNPNDEQSAQQNRAGLDQVNEQIKTQLGEQRYAEYQRAQGYEFQNLYWLTQQYDLPEESAIKIFEANKSARQRLEKLQSNVSLNEEQKAAGLRQLQEELQATIKNSLSDSAFRYFQRGGNAHWLQQN